MFRRPGWNECEREWAENVEVPRDAVHEDDASHRAPLAVPAHLRVAFAQRLARVGVVDVLKDELLEGLVRAVANVLLARVQVVPPVDLDRREGVHVLRLAQVLALLPRAVHLSEGDVVALGRLHNLVEGLLPHRREAPAPRAPRRVELTITSFLAVTADMKSFWDSSGETCGTCSGAPLGSAYTSFFASFAARPRTRPSRSMRVLMMFDVTFWRWVPMTSAI